MFVASILIQDNIFVEVGVGGGGEENEHYMLRCHGSGTCKKFYKISP